MKRTTIEDAPSVLNTNDKAMWVLGYNEGIDATIKRLAAGVSVEPDVHGLHAYSQSRLNTAIAAARVQAINDCAEELDGMKCNNKTATSAIKQCAEAIRALLGKEAT